MKKNKMNYQLNLCVSKDNLRPAMMNIYVTKENIFATNGYILVHIPTNYIFDEASINNQNWFDFYIEASQYKLLLNSTTKVDIDFQTKIATTITNKGIFKASISSADNLPFPNCQNVIDLRDESLTEKSVLNIDLNYLTIANKALNISKTEGVKIHIKERNHYYIFSKEYSELSYKIPFALVMGMKE